jgi:hypothetical protein
MDNINLSDVRAGMVFWECEAGDDALLLAVTDARRHRPTTHGRPASFTDGWEAECINVADGSKVRLYEHDRACGYGPRLYRTPQYTRPDYPALLAKLAAIQTVRHAEALTVAQARHEREIQAAHAECDTATKLATRRGAELQAAEAGVSRLTALIADIEHQTHIPDNGIGMARRIQNTIAAMHAADPA